MSAVGLTSMLAGIRRIGPRPFALGLFAALVVGGVSLLLITAFGRRWRGPSPPDPPHALSRYSASMR